LPLRPAEVRRQDELGVALEEPAQRRQRGVDAGGVADAAVLERHVEVGADEHALSGDVEIVQRAHAPRAYSFFPTRRETSRIRFEKPHSLSYHDSTLAKLPSMTWVSRLSKIEEYGLWLKSLETSGRSL